jgi:hypothetical protein
MPNSTIPGAGGQAIEGHPLTSAEIEMFEMFEREGWDHDKRREHIVERLRGPAMRTFSNIADRWGLSEQDRLQVLGISNEEEFTHEVLERVSHVLSIYRGIHTLLGVSERADRWMRAANTEPLFSGRCPVDLILEGEFVAVRRYLDAQIHPSFT